MISFFVRKPTRGGNEEAHLRDLVGSIPSYSGGFINQVWWDNKHGVIINVAVKAHTTPETAEVIGNEVMRLLRAKWGGHDQVTVYRGEVGDYFGDELASYDPWWGS